MFLRLAEKQSQFVKWLRDCRGLRWTPYGASGLAMTYVSLLLCAFVSLRLRVN
jgi:hypothetical protein